MPYELLHNGILLYRGGKDERYGHCFAGRMYPYCERKSGKLPKIDRVSRIPIEPFGDTFEQWKAALKEYNEEYLPKSLKIVLPASYSSARITQVPYAVGRQLSKMAKNVVDEHKGEDIADYSVVQSDKKQGLPVLRKCTE